MKNLFCYKTMEKTLIIFFSLDLAKTSCFQVCFPAYVERYEIISVRFTLDKSQTDSQST